jgi:hypothetical protein
LIGDGIFIDPVMVGGELAADSLFLLQGLLLNDTSE